MLFRSRQLARRDECGLEWRKSAQRSPVLCAGGGEGWSRCEVNREEGLCRAARRRILSQSYGAKLAVTSHNFHLHLPFSPELLYSEYLTSTL